MNPQLTRSRIELHQRSSPGRVMKPAREVAVLEELQHRDGADEADHRIDEGQVDEVAPPGDEGHHRDDQHRGGAEGVHRQHAVVDGGTQERADDGEHHRHDDGGGRHDVHHEFPSSWQTLRPISPSSVPSQAALVRAWISKVSPMIAGGDRSRGEGDRVGVDHPPQVRPRAHLEAAHGRADGERRVQDDPCHVQVGLEDLLREPGNVGEETAAEMHREPLVVDHAHPPRDEHHEQHRYGSEEEEERLVVAREDEPEDDHGDREADHLASGASLPGPLRVFALWHAGSVDVDRFRGVRRALGCGAGADERTSVGRTARALGSGTDPDLCAQSELSAAIIRNGSRVVQRRTRIDPGEAGAAAAEEFPRQKTGASECSRRSLSGVEVRGVEPLSAYRSLPISTCVFCCSFLLVRSTASRRPLPNQSM